MANSDNQRFWIYGHITTNYLATTFATVKASQEAIRFPGSSSQSFGSTHRHWNRHSRKCWNGRSTFSTRWHYNRVYKHSTCRFGIHFRDPRTVPHSSLSEKRILGRAIAGVCINGIIIALMIFSIPMYKKMAERAKEIQRQQQMEQQQTQP